MRQGPVRRVVIAGGGTAGWMAAAALARTVIPAGVSVVLIESETIGTVGVGEATIPPIRNFNAMLGLDEAAFVTATQGSFKLGIEFVGWGAPDQAYMHPFGDIGAGLDGVRFHQVWARLARQGRAGPFGAYSICEATARLGRFGAGAPASPLTRTTWAYHFDAGLYAAHLRAYAETRGVTRTEGLIRTVELAPEDGFVTALTLEDGRRIEGDLFIDCSGFRSLLLGQALGVAHEDWSHWLPCDRAMAVPCAHADAERIDPYTRATAEPAGWRWRIPLQHRVGNGYVYSSAQLSDDRAAEVLMSRLEGAPQAEPRPLRFTPGRRIRAWEKNCVALGLASGFLEPLESTSIHLIQAGITRLLGLFPGEGFDALEIDEYNRLTHEQIEQVRDFVILHYKLNGRLGEPMWDGCRTMEVPDSLRRRLDLFARRGRLFRRDDELFGESSWLAVLIGQGLIPDEVEPLAMGLPADAAARALAQMAEQIQAAAQAMPPHAQVLKRLRAAALAA